MRLTLGDHDAPFPEQLSEFTAFAEQLADAAAAAIAPYFRVPLDVEDKGARLFDPVTVADKAAERAMRELIRARYPEHGILGEEEAAIVGSSELTWVLDPIDGTRAFITGLPLWGTLIALNDGQRPVLGVMNQPFTGERYIGTPQGARLGDTVLKTRTCPDLASARLMCTTPDMFDTPNAARPSTASPPRRNCCASVVTATPTACSPQASSTPSSKPACSPTTYRR